MLDFNDTGPAPEIPASDRREALRAALLARLESVLFTLFPAGKKRRGKFVIGDVLGSPGDSLEVVLIGDKAGLWTDRAEGSGGDVFHLIGAHFGVDVQGDFARVLDLAEDLVGRAPTAPARKASTASKESANMVRHTPSAAKPQARRMTMSELFVMGMTPLAVLLKPPMAKALPELKTSVPPLPTRMLPVLSRP